MTIDLHLHSTASDGTLTSLQLVQLASKLNLRAISITDHDSIDGLDEAIRASTKFTKTDLIPGVELSSDLKGQSIHFLGYYINHQQKELRIHLSNLREARYQRALAMVDKLNEVGLDIAFKEILEHAGNGAAVGRAHLARVMLDKGLIDNIQEAFERYIGRDAPFYVEKYRYSPTDCINVIQKAGGIVVLAHPGIANVDEYIPEFIDEGMKGIEIYHSEHTANDEKKYIDIADNYNLLKTGGSDCHGLHSSKGLLIGSVEVPDEHYYHLREEKFQYLKEDDNENI